MVAAILSRRRRHLMGAAMLLPAAVRAEKETWPNRPVRFIVSWPPGGSADVVARLLAEQLGRRMGVPVVVENRPGAGGRIGAQLVARADPDGYTLLFGAPSELTIAAATVRALPYDPLKDFLPVTQVVSGAFMLVVDANFAPGTVADLIAYAKSNPGRMNYASYGNNTTNHIYGAQFCAATGIQAAHVPYKGGAPAWNDMMAGQIQFMFDNAAVVMPLVRSGKFKAVAVLSPDRIKLAPETPTMAEAGYPGIGMKSWLGLLAPAKTPANIVAHLHDEVAAVLAEPDFARQLDERGMPANSSTPAQFGQVLRAETGMLKGLVHELGLKLE